MFNRDSPVMPYPLQRLALDLTVVRRDFLLPEDAIGSVEVQVGQRVEARDVVARGTVPARHHIVEAAAFFRLKRPEGLEALLLVEPGQAVEQGQVLAGKSATRGKRLTSPVTGIIAYVGDGRIIIQETPTLFDLEPGVSGTVVDVHEERGVTIESMGALVQGVWGNGKRAIGPLRMEPADGIESVFGDQLNMEFRGAIVVTKRALKAVSLQVAVDQGILGIIAPSMDAALRDSTLALETAVMLTGGFGDLRLNTAMTGLFEALVGRQATLDAALPDRLDIRRPEVLIGIAVRASDRPTAVNTRQPLTRGSTVRLTRDPFAGATGKVADLPKTPTLLDNGLRVLCAKVELITGEVLFVPVENLELFGK